MFEAVVTSVETIAGITERGRRADFIVMQAGDRDVFTTTEAVGSVEPDQLLLVEFVRLPDEVRIVRKHVSAAAAD